MRRGHQRFYVTTLHELEWAYYGSGAPETAKKYREDQQAACAYLEKFAQDLLDAYEANISMGYFEQWFRKLVGPRNEMHPKTKAAWPQWGERLCDHLKAALFDGKRQLADNFPRTFEELGTFWLRFDTIPWKEKSTPELPQKGHETAEAFIGQFYELWFPRYIRCPF